MKYHTFLIIFTIVAGISIGSQANSIFTESFNSKDSTETEESKKIVKFRIRPSLGLTFGDSNSEGVRISNLQWLATVNSDFTFISKRFDISSTLFMQYGQSKADGQDPVKLQDAFVFSVTPSIPLIKLPPIRLFLETTAETNLGKGFIGENQTSFLDPLFLYQTLFIGQKHYSFQKEDKTTWELTYGAGYAFQQTLNKDFGIEHDLTGNNSSFESGFSGIIEFIINSKITERLNFVLNAKAVALSRENFFRDFDESRRSILVRSGLFYNHFGLEYNYHQVHDLNLSENALVDQSIMLTVSF